MQLHLEDCVPRIFSRTRNDWTDRFPSIIATALEIDARNVILDGEIIVPNEKGGDFNAMQNSVGPKSRKLKAQHQFQAFDIMYLDGLDLRRCRLIDRKAVVEELLKDAPSYFQIVERIEGTPGPQVYRSACGLGLAGIVSAHGWAVHLRRPH
ncbi:hypothetical protein [Variibacter gotjawalensis]|uniref:ATP-dependent DNA ligase n=1 Tax=Variibacter gotjawalensis TaxID=1333996 RepID=UPI000BBADFBF|nr:hypothetical protein [Variibacter gotjawalensis]NIK47721.1 ATP-dependent DNA ligase [Variibacter gotjawalensis]